MTKWQPPVRFDPASAEAPAFVDDARSLVQLWQSPRPKLQFERCPATWRFCDPDTSAKSVHHLFNDGKAQSGPGRI